MAYRSIENALISIESDNPEVFRRELYKNPQIVKYADEDGDSLLSIAIQYERNGIAKLLISSGANVNFKNKLGFTPLHIAAGLGQVDVVRDLIAKGANVNEICTGDNDVTALHSASAYGNIDVINELIKSGSNINAIDKEGRSAMHLAGIYNQREAYEILLKNGGNPNLLDMDGRSPENYLSK